MYLIDSDVLIDAKNRHYGFDIVPAFWDWIEREHRAGRVFTVQRVAEEVLAGADELAAWMKSQPPSFRLAAGPSEQQALQAVSRWVSGAGYAQGAVATFLQAGDYFLVAQALSLGYTVVTQETPDPASKRWVKIPDACKAVQVPWMTPFNMLRTERARFIL
jgi:Domain of unknown function (DUF4411)